MRKSTRSIYSSITVGQKGSNIYTGGCGIAWAFIFNIFDLLNQNTSKMVQNRDRNPKGGKHAFLPIWVCYLHLCEFPFSGDTLWLAKHGKDATNVPFCSKQRPWHELAAKYNNSRLVLRCGTLHWKKEVNISTVVALNSSLVQTHLRFRYLGAYSKWPPMLGQHRLNKKNK